MFQKQLDLLKLLKKNGGHGLGLTSEGRLEAEVDVLLGVEAHNEAGNVHNLRKDVLRQQTLLSPAR